jgi:hypothetical protein
LGFLVWSEVDLTVVVKVGTIRMVDGIQSLSEVKGAEVALWVDWASSELLAVLTSLVNVV